MIHLKEIKKSLFQIPIATDVCEIPDIAPFGICDLSTCDTEQGNKFCLQGSFTRELQGKIENDSTGVLT